MRACIHMMGGWVGSLMEAEFSVLTMSVLQIVQELVQVVDCSGFFILDFGVSSLKTLSVWDNLSSRGMLNSIVASILGFGMVESKRFM